MKIPEDIKKYALKRKLFRILLWLLTVAIISVIFFANFNSILESSYTKIRIIIFIVFVIFTFFAFGIPKLIFEKSFVGKIVWLEVTHTTESDIGTKPTYETLYRRVWIKAVIKLKNGKRIHKEIASKRTQRLTVPSKFQRNADEGYFANQYKIGDTVIFIAGTKYCQVYSDDKEILTCVVCGEYSSINNTNCDHCGHTIVKG